MRKVIESNGKLKNEYKYSLPTRVGMWNDELALREAEIKLNTMKKCRGKLLLQNTRDMFSSVLEPVSVATAVDNIRYGQIYQIISPYVPSISSSKNGLYISGVIDEKQIEHSHNFVHGCTITASPYSAPCKRNSFNFTSAEGNSGAINYGEDIFIQLFTSSGSPSLYLQAESNSYDTFGDCIYARLSGYSDAYSHFKILNRRPRMRKISLGSNVVPNTNVIIRHVASGKNLALELLKCIPTFFGPEYIVSCNTFQDQNRVETEQNVWKIIGKQERN